MHCNGARHDLAVAGAADSVRINEAQERRCLFLALVGGLGHGNILRRSRGS